MKRFVVVSSSEPTRRDVVAQLEDLFDQDVQIESRTAADRLGGKIRDALVLVTSTLTLEECRPFIDESCEVIVANRTLNFAHLDKLYPVPEHSSLLIVNDGIVVYTRTGTIELINTIAARLLGLGEGSNILEELSGHNRKLTQYLTGDSGENHIHHVDDSSYLFSKKYSEFTHCFLLTIKNIRERIYMENSLKSELKKQGYRAKYTFNDLVHISTAMKDLVTRSRKLAESEFSLLIYGESGTGKEMLASAIHNASKRKDGPFLAVNFSALPDDLIESELFGYEEGAFTGAKKGGKVGLFELANQGTLFLDEIGDISPKIQSRLLRVLQEREILKVGGAKNIPVDVRVVAATNRDLMEMVKKGNFREDLYYRIKKLYLQIPPLRQRKEDIRPLLSHFLVQKNGFELKMTDDVRGLLEEYDWPGNVRELENNVEYILSLCEGDVIDRSVLPEDVLRGARDANEPPDGKVLFLLETIHRFNADNVLIGRRKLSGISMDTHFRVSEQQVRRILGGLATRGLVHMGRGKVGLKLTREGMAYLDHF